jgi:hypothetical protein
MHETEDAPGKFASRIPRAGPELVHADAELLERSVERDLVEAGSSKPPPDLGSSIGV